MDFENEKASLLTVAVTKYKKPLNFPVSPLKSFYLHQSCRSLSVTLVHSNSNLSTSASV